MFLFFFLLMWNWEKTFSYCCCFCQKSSQIPQNTELGYVLMAEERASQSYSLQIVQCPSFDSLLFHRWPLIVCQVPETRTTLHGMPQWLLPCHCTIDECAVLGLVANCKFPASEEVHFSMVSVSCPPLNFLQASLVTGMMRITGVLWAIPLLASEKPERGAWERSGAWKSLPSPSKMMPSGHVEPGQHTAFLCQTTIPSSKACPATGTDLSSGCSVWKEHSQQSSLLISSKDQEGGQI